MEEEVTHPLVIVSYLYTPHNSIHASREHTHTHVTNTRALHLPVINCQHTADIVTYNVCEVLRRGRECTLCVNSWLLSTCGVTVGYSH